MTRRCPPCVEAALGTCYCEEAVNRQEKDEERMRTVELWDAECSESGCTLERWHDGLCVDEYMVDAPPLEEPKGQLPLASANA